MDSDATPSGLDPVEPLAEEFLRRRRRGDRPTPAEYAARYPEHAGRILELFPALELLEGLKPTPEDDAGLSEAPGGGSAHGRRRRPPAAAGRLHPPPRARPRRHGHRLRSRARVAQEPHGAQGHAPAVPRRPDLPAAISDRGPLGGEVAPHQHRAGVRLWRAGRRLLLRDAMYRRRRPGSGARRCPPPPGRGQQRHRGRDRRRGARDGDRRGCGPASGHLPRPADRTVRGCTDGFPRRRVGLDGDRGDRRPSTGRDLRRRPRPTDRPPPPPAAELGRPTARLPANPSRSISARSRGWEPRSPTRSTTPTDRG